MYSMCDGILWVFPYADIYPQAGKVQGAGNRFWNVIARWLAALVSVSSSNPHRVITHALACENGM